MAGAELKGKKEEWKSEKRKEEKKEGGKLLMEIEGWIS